jgi:membrane protein
MGLEVLTSRVNRVIAWADRLQRKHGVLGFPYAVVKKYGDDAGGREAALITYYGFLSIFPLLLLGVAVLSRVLAGNPDLRERLITAVVPEALRPTVEHSLAASGRLRERGGVGAHESWWSPSRVGPDVPSGLR